MAKILIDSIHAKTANGKVANINGIDINDTDCIHGSVDGINCRWDKSGICRNAQSELNINTKDNDILELIQTIEKLGG